MRIVVDHDLCQGHGVCESEAPEVFTVPKQGQVDVIDAQPPEGLRAKVELAVKYCPTHALRIVEDGMPYPREELEAMVDRWIATNRHCEEIGDWRPLADLYTDDATYGWNLGPKGEFMAVGKDQIRDIALGREMGGLDGWTYPYQEILIDERKGQVIGLWKQVADAKRADGSPYEIAGVGGSWFRYAGEGRWSWQRDFFDFGNAASLFMEMIKDGTLSEGMTKRMERVAAGDLPCHYKLGEAPVGLWEVP